MLQRRGRVDRGGSGRCIGLCKGQTVEDLRVVAESSDGLVREC